MRPLWHRNGRADIPLWDMMEDVTDTEARAGRTSAWRNDPDITDLSVRAALIGRLAGRVADLATDLQLLAMFVQTMADDVATSSAHGEDRRPSSIDHRDPTGNSVAANPSVVGDRHDRPTGEPTLLDPIDRAVQAVDALRRGLSARNSRNE